MSFSLCTYGITKVVLPICRSVQWQSGSLMFLSTSLSIIAMNVAHVPMLSPHVHLSALKPRGTGAMLMHVHMKANKA